MRAPGILVQVATLAVLGATLLAVGQPLFTDDLWWHLALGEAYAVQGPWLSADPLLFTAQQPPAPASWLADWGLAVLASSLGFEALRVLHVLAAALLFALVWLGARRFGASPAVASFATAVFAVMSAYRLVQLRPHLLTMLGALLLFSGVIAARGRLRTGRLLWAVVGLALWSNLHGGFLLGPAMLLGCGVACALAAGVAEAGEARGVLWQRAQRLGATAVIGLLATGLNPSGFARHLAIFTAGGDAPSLRIVLDEWSPLNPFALPVPDLPPSVLTWALFWCLAVAASWAVVRAVRAVRAARQGDAVLVSLAALALGSLAAMIYAVRFSWMCAFPILLVAASASAASAASAASSAAVPSGARRRSWALAAAATVLLAGFLEFGSWPMIARNIRAESFWARYRADYAPGKYYGHAVWFLHDTGLEGRLFNEYVVGGFLGYWLAPELPGFVNGTMNASAEVFDALEAIREARGVLPGESLEALLDRYEVDVFLGVGAPRLPRSERPRAYSTALLEGSEGWVQVFRDQRSAVYLRRNAANRENLERVASYYRERRVPFDFELGFQPRAVIESTPSWAARNGVAPARLRELQLAARAGAARTAALDRLGQLYAVLGLYEEGLSADRRLLREAPDRAGARRRVVWALLRTGRVAEAVAESAKLGSSPLEILLISVAQTLADDPGDALARSLVPRLPVLSEAEVARSRGDTLAPAQRGPRTSAR